MAKIRIGKCNQCGRCCRKLGWLPMRLDADTEQWLRARFPDGMIQVMRHSADTADVMIRQDCHNLALGIDGKYTCLLEHEDKPRMCRRYPGPNDELEPGCGFEFVETETI